MDPLTAATLTLNETREMATEMLDARGGVAAAVRGQAAAPDADDPHTQGHRARARAGRPGARDRGPVWRTGVSRPEVKER